MVKGLRTVLVEIRENNIFNIALSKRGSFLQKTSHCESGHSTVGVCGLIEGGFAYWESYVEKLLINPMVIEQDHDGPHTSGSLTIKVLWQLRDISFQIILYKARN